MTTKMTKNQDHYITRMAEQQGINTFAKLAKLAKLAKAQNYGDLTSDQASSIITTLRTMQNDGEYRGKILCYLNK